MNEDGLAKLIRGAKYNKKGMKGTRVFLFVENDSEPLRKEETHRLWKVIVTRAYLDILASAIFMFMAYLLFQGTLKTITATVFSLLILILILVDNRIYATKERSHKPVKIQSNGIHMPTTWFERVFLKRGFVRWTDIRAVFTVKHDIVENEQIVRGVENELVVVDKKRVTYRTGEKDEDTVKRALSTISRMWPPYSKEVSRIDKLKQEDSRFSERFASLDPSSMVFGVVLIDALFVASLGIAITVRASVELLSVFLFYLVFLDLVFGFLLLKVSRTKGQLIED